MPPSMSLTSMISMNHIVDNIITQAEGHEEILLGKNR
jgi:hypothetical protein